MPLILTTNDIVLNPDHAWNDIEGVQYHYPNQYKNKVRTGEPFIYYRGIRRQGGRRGDAEYFGHGIIGEIRQDPETDGQSRPSWYCAIEEYEPFTPPVPAKNDDGEFYEEIAPNMWRNGIRDLAMETYNKIILAYGASTKAANKPDSAMSIVENDFLIIPKSKQIATTKRASSWRKSKQAKIVGDWAEKVAIDFVRDNLGGHDIVHRAKNGETPGWDFDYRDQSGTLQRVEVKGSVSGGFTSFDLTVGELSAAQKHRESYWIFLVASCLSDAPQVQRVQNPAQLLDDGDWRSRPILFNISVG